jgi:dienelactone hydrolase
MSSASFKPDRREFLYAGAGVLLPLRLAQSLKLLRCGSDGHDSGTTLNDLKEFERRDNGFTAFGKKHRLYVKGEKTLPPVLVLHELPGLTKYDIDFAYRLSEQGFRVYLPLLFGDAYDDKFGKHFWNECVRGPWPWEDKHSFNRWVTPLSALCDRIHAETKRTIGVVGMCLTGIVPLSLLANPHVVAPVLGQPTLPFPFDDGRKRALGMTDAEVKQVAERMKRENLSALALRITTDCFCPHERFATLLTILGPQHCDCREITYPANRHGHSVLAVEYHTQHPPPGVREAFDDTVAFLKRALA